MRGGRRDFDSATMPRAMMHLRRFLTTLLLTSALSSATAQSRGGIPTVPARHGPLAEAPDRSFITDGVSLHYREAGDGQAIVLVHGWARTL
ncbi:MAG: hypothetical protein ACRDMZ_11100, partial [Solirubrobacteraceae bacterium]